MLGIMILSTYAFVLGMDEITYLVYFIGYFYGTRDDVSGPHVGLISVEIITASEISIMNLKDPSTISRRTELYSFLLILENYFFKIILYVMDLSIVLYSIVGTSDENIE